MGTTYAHFSGYGTNEQLSVLPFSVVGIETKFTN